MDPVGVIIILVAGVALWYAINRWVLPYQRGAAG